MRGGRAEAGRAAASRRSPSPSRRSRPVTDYDEYVGRFIAVDSVEIRARVSGYLDKVAFKDGQIVKQGDLAVHASIAARSRPRSRRCARRWRRRAPIWPSPKAISPAPRSWCATAPSRSRAFEQRTQAKRVAEASVAAQEAAVRQAELDLQFTELKAPVDRTDRRPARIGRQSGDRRHLRQHHAARHHRVDRPDPLRVHLR